MFKRTASEEAHSSNQKKIKTDNDMPPPRFVPKQPVRMQEVAPRPSVEPNVNFKLQTSICDAKTHQNDYFSDDDEDDNDLWYKASQIEEQVQRGQQKNSPELSYADFKDAQGTTSTQNHQSSQMDVFSSQRIRVLQNKCTALEKQLKRNLPNIAKVQAQASQAKCEVNELKTKIKQLRLENEDLRKQKLNEADKISISAMNIRNENEILRKQVAELERKVEKSEKSRNEQSPLNVTNVKINRMIFEENKNTRMYDVITRATAFRQLRFQEGVANSIFDHHLISLQLKIAALQNNLMRDEEENFYSFNNLRICKGIDDYSLFNEITNIIFAIFEDIRSCGLRHMDEHFVRQEFALKQAQYLSDQYFGDRKNLLNKPVPLTDCRKLFIDEIRTDHRRLIAMISILMKNSAKLSQMMLVQNVSTKSDHATLTDLLCDIIDPHILQSRFLYQNSGLTTACTDLIKNLSLHYDKFDNNTAINNSFDKLFSHLLAMSTNSPEILINLSEFLVNISKHENGSKLLQKLCKNIPSSNLEYSHIFKIYQIPRCGCMLQIFFILLSTAFRFIENVHEYNLELLFDLVINLNTLVYLFIVNGCDLLFLKPESHESCDLKSHCKCYMFLVITLIILNNQALKNRNVDTKKYYLKLSNIAKSSVVSMVALLSYSGQTIDYRSFPFGYNAINEIYTWLRHGDIYINESDKFFSCQEMLFSQNAHEKFLDKILASMNCDFSYSFVTCESNLDENVIDENVKSAKDILMNEITEHFHSDESESMRSGFWR